MTLDALLAPKSIAILGASERGASARVREGLGRLGFDGPLHLVNPGRGTVAGQPCHPSVAAIGEPVDLAVLALSTRHVLPALQQCAAAGIPAAVVFASGFAEADPDGMQLQTQITALARAHDMAILGPNCMGYVRPAGRRAVYLDHLWRSPPPGGVALITQSGSVGVGALNHTGTLALSAMISVGNEAVVTTADVIDWLVSDEATRAIAIFLEDTSRIRPLLHAAERAALGGKRLVVCRAGRSPAGARAAQTHTGALATPDRALRAVLRAHGVVVVDDLDELTAAAEILATKRRTGRHLTGLTVSGGHVGLLHDLAVGTGLSFPEPDAHHAAALEAALGERRALHNPLDAWADADVAGGFDRAAQAVRNSKHHDGVIAIVDAPATPPTSDPDLSLSFARSITSASTGDDRVWVMATSTVAADDDRVTHLARAAGCPRINGLRTALVALGAVATARRTAQAVPADVPEAAQRTLPDTEAGGYELLRRYGIPTPKFRVCPNADSAAEAAAQIGYPVVAKAHVPGLQHKTAAGAVALDLGSEPELRTACTRLAASFPGAHVLIAAQADPGVDVLVGARYDRHLGPVLVVGTGGTLTEFIDDVAILPAPAEPAAIQDALTSTRINRMLMTWPGADSAGYQALIRVIEHAGTVICNASPPGAAVDINPVRVTTAGAIALDYATAFT